MEKFETFDGTYLKKYYYFAFILTTACVICIALLGIFAFTKNTWSYGIIVLLALSLVLAILAIISWVALYREKGRYHERRFPIEVDNKMKSLKAKNQSLNEGIQSLKADIQSLKDENKNLTEANIELKEAEEQPSEEN